MLKSNIFYEKLERNFISWAQNVEDIRAAFIVGSRARNDHPADEWSDMDIIFFTSKQNYYLSDNEWIKNLGNVWTSLVSLTAGGDPECLTLFEETQMELRNSFGHFDRNDSWKALIGTITLFKRLSHDISQRMNFSYPYDLENNVSDWISQNTNLVT